MNTKIISLCIFGSLALGGSIKGMHGSGEMILNVEGTGHVEVEGDPEVVRQEVRDKIKEYKAHRNAGLVVASLSAVTFFVARKYDHHTVANAALTVGATTLGNVIWQQLQIRKEKKTLDRLKVLKVTHITFPPQI